MAYRSVLVWLEDIINAIQNIKTYTLPFKDHKEFISEQLIVDAAERNLEIIAEALKNALKEDAALPISNSKQIIGLRNIISHNYYEVKYDIIWEIIKIDLPVLETEVRKILEDYERRLELNEL